MTKLKHILTIAGHDPSGGAGIISDIKTFETYGLHGLSVCTCITVQNDIEFRNCSWTSSATMLAQIRILFERFEINTVKIGLIESWSVLLNILEKLHALNADIKVILDPIFSASAGFDFHQSEEQHLLNRIWKLCYMITPNDQEIESLYPNLTREETLEHISSFTNVYLKGGHRKDKKGWDALYLNKIVMIDFPPTATEVAAKHGSGCIVSAALASNIDLGIALEDACKNAKYYTEQFLNSHPSLLGIHTKMIIQ